MTQSAVDLIQLVGKYMFSGGGAKAGDNAAQSSEAAGDVPDYLQDETPTPKE